MRKADMGKTIKKRHIEAVVLFAIDHIPQIDPDTLEKFLELINANGNFGSVSDQHLLRTMSLLTKHVPGACGYSLLTLAELLDICVPVQVTYKLKIIPEDFQPTWVSR
jgi:hypothetical protein